MGKMVFTQGSQELGWTVGTFLADRQRLVIEYADHQRPKIPGEGVSRIGPRFGHVAITRLCARSTLGDPCGISSALWHIPTLACVTTG
jgi:hypothetical protein